MKYTHYIAAVTKENGPPQLDSHQFRRLMNIVHIEGELKGLRKAKSTYENTPQFYRYDVLIFKIQRQLTDLTGNLDPKVLLQEMYRLTGND